MWIDVLILIIVVASFATGLMRGLIGELVSTFSVIVACVVARLYASEVGMWVEDAWTLPEPFAEAVGYALVFVAITLLIELIGRFLRSLVRAVHLTWLNRLLGGVFGFIKGAILAMVFVFLLGHIDHIKPVLSEGTRTESRLYSPVYDLANDCLSITRSQLGEPRTDTE